MHTRSTFVSLAIILAATTGCAAEADDDGTPAPGVAESALDTPSGSPIGFHADVRTRAAVRVAATFDSCTNHPGNTIRFTSDSLVDGIDGTVIAATNRNKSDSQPVEIAVRILDPYGDELTFEKSAVTGNPLVYIQFTDDGGNALSQKIYAGRCVQGGTLSASLVTGLLAAIDGEGLLDCSNHPGTDITLSGGVHVGGVHAILTLQNPPGVRSASTPVTVSVDATPPFGGHLVFDKHRVAGNPWISLALSSELDGATITLGRCVQSSH